MRTFKKKHYSQRKFSNSEEEKLPPKGPEASLRLECSEGLWEVRLMGKRKRASMQFSTKSNDINENLTVPNWGYACY